MTNELLKTLLKLEKHFSEEIIELPSTGTKVKPFLVLSDSTRDTFLIDIDRQSTISISKAKLQERYVNESQVLIRLEIDAPEHRNPDGKLLSRNHMHIFTEEYGLSLAYDLEDLNFTNVSNFMDIFYDFCTYCNISITKTKIQGVM